VGQIYLMGETPIDPPAAAGERQAEAARPLGQDPRLNVLYAHLNLVVRAWDLDMIFLAGPGTAAQP